MDEGEQLSLFQAVDGTKPGDTTEDRNRVGRPLTWEEACAHIGRPIWYARIQQSLTYYEAVIPEKRCRDAITFFSHDGEKLVAEKSDRLLCYDGTRQRLLLDEHYFRGGYIYPESCVFYGMKEET